MVCRDKLLNKLEELSDKEKGNKKEYRYFSVLAEEHSLCFAPMIATNPYMALIKFIKGEYIHSDKFDVVSDNIGELIDQMVEDLNKLDYNGEHKDLQY